jgi:hypothetical protein
MDECPQQFRDANMCYILMHHPSVHYQITRHITQWVEDNICENSFVVYVIIVLNIHFKTLKLALLFTPVEIDKIVIVSFKQSAIFY